MIPKETVDLILDTARIEDVVGDFVTLKRRGANFVACCPFHQEKTPSFYVSPAKGIYKCFGCGKSGSAVGFVMEHEHYSYTEALRYIARRYNIEIVEEEESEEEKLYRQRSESLLMVSEFAQGFFVKQLESGEGRDVGLSYYHSRRLEDETIRKFGLGWAPSAKDALVQAAKAAGYKEEYLLDAGLAVKKEDGTVADKFRERVMFPIHSVSGRVIAFSGRTLRSDNPAKYVNSPDTEIYKKSNILFGIWLAKQEISRNDKCIIVEGNVDLVMLHQLGICNVVAPCGTALTVQQVRLIRKFTDNITLMNDGDSAGIHASLKDIDLILYEGLNVKVVLLPDGEDPDSFARTHTLEEVKEYIESGEKDFLDFKSDILLADAAGDPLKKANFVNDIADTIARIPDPVKRSTYVNSAAEKFDVQADIIFQRVNSTRGRLLEEERRVNEREQRQAAAGRTQGEMPADTVAPADGNAYQPENRILDAVERQLLNFLLMYGMDDLVFETDSKLYDPNETPKVAGFIGDTVDDLREPFANSLYDTVYRMYMDGYDKGLEQEEILNGMLNSPDRRLASLAADLSQDRYMLSVENLRNSMTSKESWLAFYVPKTLAILQERRIFSRMEDIRKALRGAAPEAQLKLLTELVELQKKHAVLKEKLEKEIFT